MLLTRIAPRRFYDIEMENICPYVRSEAISESHWCGAGNHDLYPDQGQHLLICPPPPERRRLVQVLIARPHFSDCTFKLNEIAITMYSL